MKWTLKNVLGFSNLILLLAGYLFFTPYVIANINGFTTTTNLPHSIASNVSHAYNNNLFILGGATNSVIPTHFRAEINPLDGSLMSWNSSTPLPPTFWHASSIKNNNVYILGGATFPPTSSVNTVYLGRINSLNEISIWELLPTLPKKLSQGASLIVQNKIYFGGGFTEVSGLKTFNQSIYSAEINPDGTISSWTQVGLLPHPMHGFGFVATDDGITVIGGYTAAGVSSKVYSASITPSGSIGAWEETSALPEPVYRSGIVKVGSTIYSLGGITAGDNTLNKIYFAAVHNDGTVEPWELSNNTLPLGICCGSVTTNNNYIYITGGHNTNTGEYFATTYYTKVLDSSTISLPVPLLKQTAEPWQSHIYDSANKWNPSNPTINAFGCAMTSAAMILQYYNVNKLPDGTTLDPGTLNTWLKTQPDGYIGNGLINWQAIARLSRKAKSQNPDFQYNALEYKRGTGDANLLTAEIQNNRPAVLGVPGHFIVGKGISGNTFEINDPFYNRTLLTDGYNNLFQSIHRYIPSFTDLSYMLILSPEDINVSILNGTNIEISESYIQDPIRNPNSPSENNGNPQKITYVEKPESSNYTIIFTSTNDVINNSHFYLYDSYGEVIAHEIKGVLHPETQDTYRLTFNPESNTDTNLSKEMSPEVLIDEIKTLRRIGSLHFSMESAALAILNNVEKDLSKNNISQALKKLDALSQLIEKIPQKLIDQEAKTVLLSDIEELKETLEEN